MEAQTFEYRGYKIVVTQAPPFWEAAIHPSHPSLPQVDWTHAPIRGHNEKERRSSEAHQRGARRDVGMKRGQTLAPR